MIELSAVRVLGGGGGRRGACRQVGLTQRDELQGRIHGPAHQLSERALVLATVDHRREHVFARLRSASDGMSREMWGREAGICGFGGAEPKAPARAARDLAAAARA